MVQVRVVWRPLLLIAAGLPVIAIDMRTEHVDLIPDPAGWGLIAVGLWQVGLRWPARFAGVATVLSLADFALPSRFVAIDTVTGEEVRPGDQVLGQTREHLRHDHVSGLRLAAVFAAMLLGLIALLWMVDEFRRRARVGGRPKAAVQLEILRWALALTAIPLLGAAGWALLTSSDFDPVWNDRAEYWAMPSIVVFVWLALVLGFESGRRWAMPRLGLPSRFRRAFPGWQA